LRDAAAAAVPAASTEVPLLECWASTEPKPFAATEPFFVMAFTPPAAFRLADCVVFCAVADATGAALALTFGLGVRTWGAGLAAALAAVVAALVVAALAAAVDSVEPATLAAALLPVLETLPAD
jgi:hypothetical protein